MTIEDFHKLPWRFNTHMSMADEHITTYRCTDPRYVGWMVCDHVRYVDGEPRGKGKCHYLIGGKVLKTKKALIKELENYGN